MASSVDRVDHRPLSLMCHAERHALCLWGSSRLFSFLLQLHGGRFSPRQALSLTLDGRVLFPL